MKSYPTIMSPIHVGLIQASNKEDFTAEVRAAQLSVVHELQHDLGFLRSSHDVLAVGYLQRDGPPT